MANYPEPAKWEPGRPPKWIPIELGLPDPEVNVLVTVSGGFVTVGRVIEAWWDDLDSDYCDPLSNGHKFRMCVVDEWYGASPSKDEMHLFEVVAWCYYPMPYEGKGI